jgi:glutathione S-transferase
MIVLHELRLNDSVELVRAVASPRGIPNPQIMAVNPLGRIPVLLRQDEEPLFESSVICEALCESTDGGEVIFPRAGAARLTHLRWQALADGFASYLLSYRDDKLASHTSDPARLVSLHAKIKACLRQLELETEQLAAMPFGIGHVAIVCALGQLDFRFPNSSWQKAVPHLAGWYSGQGQRPSIAATRVVDDSGETGPPMDLTFEGGV